jgi:microcystin-dependent protein
MELNRYDSANENPITVEDGSFNTETSLTFLGKNVTGYGKVVGENFLHLLENFARATPPTNPIRGQLWYDTGTTVDPARPQLKVFDGTTWTAAGSVIKSSTQPLSINSTIGDLWVDTTAQQLYLFTGSTWVLVGPQFNAGNKTGFVTETIADIEGNNRTILSNYVGGIRLAIFSVAQFIPRSVIDGFESIQPGVNLSTKNIYSAGQIANKFTGVSEKAEALVVNGVTVPAANFIRSDVSSTSDSNINVRNNAGIAIGLDLSTTIGLEEGSTVVYNKTAGSSIELRLNNNGTPTGVLKATSNGRVGINRSDPQEALDVVGNVQASGQLILTNTTDSISLATGSAVISGGVAIGKKLNVGGDLSVDGSVFTGDLAPQINNLYNLGTNPSSGGNRWNNVFAQRVDADIVVSNQFTGFLNGNISGAATRLTQPTNFKLEGDISSNTITFDGAPESSTLTFTTTIDPTYITTKTEVTDVEDADEFIIFRPLTGIRKTKLRSIKANIPVVPIGAIFPYAGPTPPPGYLLCDGSEVLTSTYTALFNIIGYTYRDPSLLLGGATFALPDLRGRFPLGRDNMDNGLEMPNRDNPLDIIDAGGGAANRVTSVTADTIGLTGGFESVTLTEANLPDHAHDLRGDAGNQFYGFRNVSGSPTDTDAIAGNGPTGALQGQYLNNSGGVKTNETLATPFQTLPPYQTINYIIYTGVEV